MVKYIVLIAGLVQISIGRFLLSKSKWQDKGLNFGYNAAFQMIVGGIAFVIIFFLYLIGFIKE